MAGKRRYPRTKYETTPLPSTVPHQRKCVLQVPDPDSSIGHEHPDHIESVVLARTSVPVDPSGCRTNQVIAFTPVNCLRRISILNSGPRLHLDKRDEPVTLRDEVNVTVPGTIPSLEHPPAASTKPTLGDSLSGYAETICLTRHSAKIGSACYRCVTVLSRAEAWHCGRSGSRHPPIPMAVRGQSASAPTDAAGAGPTLRESPDRTAGRDSPGRPGYRVASSHSADPERRPRAAGR
jgi:hypothetical protein